MFVFDILSFILADVLGYQSISNKLIKRILLTNTSYKDPLYESPEGKDFINLVWDIYQTEIITNRTSKKRPTPIKAIKKIVTEAKDITKNLPNSKMSNFIKNCPPSSHTP